MTLDAVEFLRRFLLHVLPTGLVRIRQFGFLANRVRTRKLRLCALCWPHLPLPLIDPVLHYLKLFLRLDS
jgi:putative transposase